MSSTRDAELWREQWDIAGTVSYILSRGFKRITLQFPDELLEHSTRLAGTLQSECRQNVEDVQVFVLADTSYNSLSVDEVAAQHANADCVVHYGRASLSPLSRLPAYFVFGRADLDVPPAAARIAQRAIQAAGEAHRALLLLPDQLYAHAAAALRNEVDGTLQKAGEPSVPVIVASVAATALEPFTQTSAENASARAHATKADVASQERPGTPPDSGSDQAGPSGRPSPDDWAGRTIAGAGLVWDLPPGVAERDCLLVWLGPDDVPALLQLQMTHHRCQWGLYDPAAGGAWQEGLPVQISRSMKRRYYLVEKTKNAAIIGILVGTLGVVGYLRAVDELRALIRRAGKKSYTMLMGKPNPAKLANFPEIEVWVLVADGQGMILDSKEYLAPIVTPFEAYLALSSGQEWTGDYRLDFNCLLDGPAGAAHAEPRFSLVDGQVHGSTADDTQDPTDATALAKRADAALQLAGLDPRAKQMVQVQSAAEFMVAKRSYTGLEAPMVGAEPKAVVQAVPGRSGRAAVYDDEPAAGGR